MSAATGTDWTRILSDPDLVRHVEDCCRPTAKPRWRNAKTRYWWLCVRSKRAATAAAKSTRRISLLRPSQCQVCQLPLLPHLRLNPICSVPIGDPTAVAIRESSASSPSSFGSTKRRRPSGAIFPIPAWVDVWWKPRALSSPGRRSKSACGCPTEKSGSKGLRSVVWLRAAAPANGVRVRFDGMVPPERESLRQFLKFVQETTRAFQSESTYLQLLK